MDYVLIRENMLTLTKVTINIQAGNMNEFTRPVFCMFNHHSHMILLMLFVKGVVAGNNIPLNIVDDFLRNDFNFSILTFLSKKSEKQSHGNA